MGGICQLKAESLIAEVDEGAVITVDVKDILILHRFMKQFKM